MTLIRPDSAIKSPRLAQPFTIIRSSGAFGQGGWQEGPVTEIPTRGPVCLASGKELAQVPEGDRAKGIFVFYAPIEIHTTHGDGGQGQGISDKIMHHGKTYKIINSKNYLDYGYCKAMGLRQEGD